MITEYQYQWLEDLFDSPKVYLYSASDGLVRSVKVSDDTMEFKTYENNKMFNFSIKVEDEIQNIRY